MGLITTTSEWAGRIDELPQTPLPDRVLMADPRDFDVLYAINPHMLTPEGDLQRVDRELAREQWQALRQVFEGLGLTVEVVPPLPAHPDLVFCANQVLPVSSAISGRGAELVPARMASPERAAEVPHVVTTLEGQGYDVRPLEGTGTHEGTGDGLWHPGRRLLWAGVGPRSTEEAWRELAERYDLPVIQLNLADADFYHLDTCLCLLDERTCLWVPEAFDARGRALVEALIPRRLEPDPTEARKGLAANACSLGNGDVLIESSCRETARSLEDAGYRVHPVETGEFLKAGGSVFCMKLLHGPLP